MPAQQRSHHITVSSPDYLGGLREDAGRDGWTRWTTSSLPRLADYVYFYFTEPYFAIEARARVIGAPTPEHDPGSEFDGRLMCDLDDIQFLYVPLPLAGLKFAFPAWRYWLQPRSLIRIPDEYAPRLSELVTHFINPRWTPALAELSSVCEDYGGRRAYASAMRRVARLRRPMLEALAIRHSLTPDGTLAYVASNARWHEDMTFDESLGALANYLELPAAPRRPTRRKKKGAAGVVRSLKKTTHTR